MTDLERALSDLAGHLDIPSREDPDAELAERLRAPGAGGRRRQDRMRALLAVAAAIVVVSAAVLVVAPARDAVAGWLGIGSVEVRRSAPIPIPSSSTTRPSASTSTTRPATTLADARKAVQFEIVLPRDVVETPSKIAVDRRVPGGLVTLTYPAFTLVEIATDTTQPPPLAKLVGGAGIEQVEVHGHDGMWIPEVHQIGYIDRAGNFKRDTVRRSGPVLLWERDGVTYRVEGPSTMDEAMTIANSIV